MYGVGPIYGGVIIAVTAAAVIAGNSDFFESGIISAVKIPSLIIGILLIVLGLYMWINALLYSKIDDHITNNKLATGGVYSWVRNPIYSAFMFFCTGALFISGNVYLYQLFFYYLLFMTLLMKNTEEKWLENLYGDEYREYKKRVNRCIPWRSKK